MFKKFSIFFISSTLVITSLFSPNISDDSFKWPSNLKSISSNFSNRVLSQYNSSHFHNGVDIPAGEGSNISCISNGTVIFADFYGAYGYTIMVSHYNGYKSQYSHMSPSFNVHTGEYVEQGQIIGKVGPKYLPADSPKYYLSPGSIKTNGMTTGPHLHFTLYKDNKLIDPLSIDYEY